MQQGKRRIVIVLSAETTATLCVVEAAQQDYDVQAFSSSAEARAFLASDSLRPYAVVAQIDLEEDPAPVFAVCGEGASGLLWFGSTRPPSPPEDWSGVCDWMPELLDPLAVRFRVDHVARMAEQADQRVWHERVSETGSWIWETDTDKIRWSTQALHVLGTESRERIATPDGFIELVHSADRERVRKAFGEQIHVSRRFDLEHRVAPSDDCERTVRLRARWVEGRVAGTIQDVTQEAEFFRHMRYLADHDSLTGLPNRRYFCERIERSVKAARRNDHNVALLFIDLDGFKAVNDSLGHEAGDQLLAEIADRVLSQVRMSDSLGRCRLREEPPVSRLGGDEFALLLTKVDGPSGAELVAQRLTKLIAEPSEIAGHEITPSASIGISLFPLDAEDADSLLNHADQAMYQAKQRGPNNYAFYDESMNTASLRRLTVTSRLRHAIDQGQVEVQYQPRMDLGEGCIAGGEALARWTDDTLGKVGPAEFIPVAEGTGLILPLGRCVMEIACGQIRAWCQAGLDDFVISVNVSPQQFARENVVAWIAETLAKHEIDPRYLELEITENLFLGKTQGIEETLRELRAMGVRVALDDFGTGYSSLSYLLQFPIDTLKIDRCLIKNVPEDPDATGVVKALIEMGRALGIRIVAEGIDSEPQADWLTAHGCDELQGFFVSGAVSPAKFESLLRGEISR